jgi:hypothetical protein
MVFLLHDLKRYVLVRNLPFGDAEIQLPPEGPEDISLPYAGFGLSC